MKWIGLLFFVVLFSGKTFAQRVSSTHFFYFESSSARLSSLEEKNLKEVCDTLKQFSVISISVAGHTDDTNTEEENLILSEERAKSVKEILIKNNISPLKITLVAMGETNPLELNSTEKGKARNRRVEVKVVYE
jgi:outer membrane protein OmpA-like peptidoglycan-associated protein